ncbi:GNAT family N-acetyltransferase [Thalassobacillus hwangdonensis]|uniref:GNAT family N-acetyltransferase n=1 Tax=Thalassobacillus hwangdonensis TaxID=546108 RepID=A0ABW3L4M1_9BACI
MEIKALHEVPERFDEAVDVFWGEWGGEDNYAFYRDCMEHSSTTSADLPRFYLALDGEKIVGTYALLRNDLNSRQDLCPWLACLYIDPAYRGKGLGAKLLEDGLNRTNEKGYDTLYLTTDLEGYYEKYGWKHTTDAIGLGGGSIKVYEKATKR